jgi:hypothetical protein
MIKSLLKNEQKQSFTSNIHDIILKFIFIYELEILLLRDTMFPKHLTVLSMVFDFAWIGDVFGFRFTAFLNTGISSIRNKISLIAGIGNLRRCRNEYFMTELAAIYFL